MPSKPSWVLFVLLEVWATRLRSELLHSLHVRKLLEKHLFYLLRYNKTSLEQNLVLPARVSPWGGRDGEKKKGGGSDGGGVDCKNTFQIVYIHSLFTSLLFSTIMMVLMLFYCLAPVHFCNMKALWCMSHWDIHRVNQNLTLEPDFISTLTGGGGRFFRTSFSNTCSTA